MVDKVAVAKKKEEIAELRKKVWEHTHAGRHYRAHKRMIDLKTALIELYVLETQDD